MYKTLHHSKNSLILHESGAVPTQGLHHNSYKCNRVPVTRLTTQFSYMKIVYFTLLSTARHSLPCRLKNLSSTYAMTKGSRARPISIQLSDVDQSLPLLLQLAPPAAGSRPPASNGRLSPRYSLPVLVKIPPGILGMVDSPQNLGLVQLLSYVP